MLTGINIISVTEAVETYSGFMIKVCLNDNNPSKTDPKSGFSEREIVGSTETFRKSTPASDSQRVNLDFSSHTM